ncbi:MAG: 5'-methylthioadenosine/S-adenosylhomocysteine nucleosidase [Ruminococcaceae bacterium]|nr:5'-methylthioadenosine/S-adenosylhomocysteine nucleosidase [Oscillospiraceae bacterium]
MTGISIAAKREWNAVLDKFQMNIASCTKYPFGEYFTTDINGESIIFYRCGVRKMNSSAATQYMIDHFDLEKIIVAGSCAGIDDKYKTLDIFIPNKAVQYDCTVKEQEPLIKDSFTVNFNLDSLGFDVLTGTIGTADKAVVMWKDYLELKENNIAVADTESAAIAYICKANNVECTIIKGISDFPINEQETSNKEQMNAFSTNVPIIMNKIIDDYLPLALQLSVKYND